MNDGASTIIINSILTDIKNINIKINTLSVQLYELNEVVKSMVKLIMESVETKEEESEQQ